jgi:TolB-like protein
MALAHTHFIDARMAWTKSQAESLKLAVEFTKKALTLNPEDSFAHSLQGSIYLFQRQYDKAIAEGQRAISIDPNFADGYAILSQTMCYSGRFEEALALIKTAMRLCPIPRVFYPLTLGRAYLDLERYEKAIPAFKQLQERCRRGECPPQIASVFIIVSYMGLGREEEARAEAEELLKLKPDFSLDGLRKTQPYKDPAHLESWLRALRKAGIPEKPPLPPPDKPSIAVLPFDNLNRDPKQDYFVDGITDDLITDLSKISGLFVIARSSVFRYKGKPVDVKKVSRELGVKHVLEGSVRKAGNQVRINAKLIEASTGGHLWAERYDGKMDDVFALQDEITTKIVKALAVELTPGEQEQVAKKETENITAYDSFLKARAHYLRYTPEDFAKALSHFENTIETDPNYRRAYFFMALIYSKASKLGKRWLDALDLRNAQVADGQAKKYLELSKCKMVFVTSARYSGNLGGVAGADEKCQQLAEAALLPGIYKAWLSDKSSSPASTFTRWNGPYVLVDGTEVASNWYGFTEEFHFVPIKITETGQDARESLQWTNTTPSGGPGPGRITRDMLISMWGRETADVRATVRDGSCQNWTSSNGDLYDGLYGNSIGLGQSWTYNTASPIGAQIADCDKMLRLYCFQQ